MRGKCWKYGPDINTDLIIPARYLNTTDPQELAKHCMEDVDTAFVEKVGTGDIIVADKNFGCGSSREHAPLAIKASGVACVIAKSFARIFYRNAFNVGLPVIVCPEAFEDIAEGDVVEVTTETGSITNITQGTSYSAEPIPPFMQEIINHGGLMEYVAAQQSKPT
jgi:3-isopropylmalate dehydratase small subunit